MHAMHGLRRVAKRALCMAWSADRAIAAPLGPSDVLAICDRLLQASMFFTTASSRPERCLCPSLSMAYVNESDMARVHQLTIANNASQAPCAAPEPCSSSWFRASDPARLQVLPASHMEAPPSCQMLPVPRHTYVRAVDATGVASLCFEVPTLWTLVCFSACSDSAGRP